MQLLDKTTIINLNHIVVGEPTSRGIATGRIRFVSKESDISDIRPDDIILIPTASAKWAEAASLAVGVISTIGGPLSSLGTIARELGKPAVFGVGSEDSKLVAGSFVEIDGYRGEVKC